MLDESATAALHAATMATATPRPSVEAAATSVQSVFRGHSTRRLVRGRPDSSPPVPLDQSLRNTLSAIRSLQVSLFDSPETSVPNNIDLLREFLHAAQPLVSAAQTSLALRILLASSAQRTTRSDYLLPLSERIGPAPARAWEAEWDDLTRELHGEEERVGQASLTRALSGAQLTSSGSALSLFALLRDPSRAQQLLEAQDAAAAADGQSDGRRSSERE